MIISPAYAQSGAGNTTTILQLAPLALIVVVFVVARSIAIKRRQRAGLPTSLREAHEQGALSNGSAIIRFRNPSNGYDEEVSTPWIWCLLFGCIYFAVKGIWTHAVAALALAFVTFGLSWLIYPLFARQIVERHYMRMGWQPISM